ncbi:GDP-mannose 4,6-dehydratase [Candidatus Parcubacteria bacterium]|nr:GDP-mannose 4,6-dehydratase [Candidatus Parcubacteria bacterium]
MKILVTGGAGFIGSHLVDRLVKERHKVIVIDNLSTGSKKNLNPKAKFYKLDIRNPKVSDVFKKEKPEAVFHLAAQIDLRKSVENPVEDAKINILGSLNILQNFIRINQLNPRKSVSKFIFTSTGGAIYGDADIIPTPETYPEMPLSPYGVEKLVFDKYLNYYYKVFGLPYVSLRLSNVYGPRQNSKGEAGVIAIFCDKMLGNKQPIINGSGKQTRDYVYVDDVVEAGILAFKKKKIGIFNIGTAQETDVNTIFRKIRKLINSDCKEIHVPEKPGEQKTSCLDCSKAKKELGWQPRYDLDKGLKETVEWFKNKLAY